jgi:hypothetical protein
MLKTAVSSKGTICVNSAIDSSAQDFLADDNLLLPIVKVFAVHSLTSRYSKYMIFLVYV